MVTLLRPVRLSDFTFPDREPDESRPEVSAAMLERAGIDLDQFESGYDDTRYEHVERTTPVEGATCDPDRLPDGVPAGWVCQFSGDWEEQLRPARIMNARKGDILLSSGGDGVIGGFLRQVSPPQRYSHALICTEDQVEVAHVMGASDWLKAQHTGGLWSPPFKMEPAPSDGLRPDALKYIWPGGVIQSADEVVNGSEFQAPEGTSYRLSGLSQTGFSRFETDWEAVPPLVLKPAPEQEEAVRGDLHRMAEIAREHCISAAESRAGRFSKLHYRLFAYTDATYDTPAPAGESWYAGTLPAVCSSFVWMMARRAGIRRFRREAGDGAPADHRTRPDVPDGLSHYSPEERANAAFWLHEYYQTHVKEHLRERTGYTVVAWLWNRVSDMANDLSNQVLNTFAHDWTETEAKDSLRWRDEPRSGVAVSPDDLRRWPGPEEDGGWGSAEPLVYRSSRPELVPRHVWRRVTGRDTLTKLVRYAGAAVAGTRVKIGGQDLTADAFGVFRVELPAGDYIVDAGRLIEGVGYVEARMPVTIPAGQGETVTVHLQEPSDVFRRVVIQATGWLRNQRTAEGEHGEAAGFRRELDVQPWNSRETWTWTAELDDEIHVELACTASVRFDRSVEVRLEGAFYEMDDEARIELEMTETQVWTIAPGASETCHLCLWNEARRDPGDNLELTITMTNERQP